MVFEGVRGSNNRGDIAIDDITFTAGSCGNPGNLSLKIYLNISFIVLANPMYVYRVKEYYCTHKSFSMFKW